MFMVATVICLGIILFLIRRDIRKTREFDRAFRVLTNVENKRDWIKWEDRDWIKWKDIERELKQSEEVQKSYNDISFKGLNNPED